MMCALYVLRYVKRHLSVWSVKNSSLYIALAVVELHWYESISQSAEICLGSIGEV